MPIPGIEQPEYIQIDDTLRLRRYDGVFDFAVAWYQDAETVRLVSGDGAPYDAARVRRMYEFLQRKGELYFIEQKRDGLYVPVGDVAFWPEDMSIVIGDRSLRGRGIGGRVVAALIGRARRLGLPGLRVAEIYDYNAASRRMFERAGFCACAKTEKGHSFKLEL